MRRLIACRIDRNSLATEDMRIRFTSGNFEFEFSAGYPPPCSDGERDPHFESTLTNSDRFPPQLTVHQTTSWIIARLSALTYGDMQSINDGEFCNDGGEFAYKFKITDKQKQLVGRCGLIFFRNAIQYAGFSKEPYNIKKVFTDMLLADPSDLRDCEIHSQDAETHDSVYFGYDGYKLR